METSVDFLQQINGPVFYNFRLKWFNIESFAISNQSFNVLDATVLLCDFHLEQSWERWLTTKANGYSEIKIEILASLRAIAKSKTVQEFTENLEKMRSANWWRDNKHSKIVDCFNKSG